MVKYIQCKKVVIVAALQGQARKHRVVYGSITISSSTSSSSSSLKIKA